MTDRELIRLAELLAPRLATADMVASLQGGSAPTMKANPTSGAEGSRTPGQPVIDHDSARRRKLRGVRNVLELDVAVVQRVPGGIQ